MYTTLICFLFTSYIFFIFGNKTIYIFNKKELINYSFFDFYFIGLCTVGCLFNFWSLFLPTNFIVTVILLFVSLIVTIKNKKYYSSIFKSYLDYLIKNKSISFLFLLVTIIVLLFAVILPRNYDSYLYHINAIQWIEKFRVVPGLANLHNRFGLNSSLFVLCAGFSFSELYNQTFFIINSLTYLFFFYWLIKEIFIRKGAAGFFLLLFLYFFTQQYGSDISSPGTDLLPNVLVSYILINLLTEKDVLFKKYLMFIIITLFCLTLKLTIFPIVTIGLIAIHHKFKNVIISIKQLSFFCVIILTPWFIRNIILTGYIIYPFEGIDLFHFDWQVSHESLIDINKWICSWGRVPFKDCNIVLQMPFKIWFRIWWQNALFKNQIFYILSLFSPLFIIVYYLIYKKENNNIFYFSIVVGILGVLFWFFTSPDIRFCFAFVLILALFPIFIFENIIDRIKIFFNPLLIISLFYILFLISQDSYKLFCEDYHSIKKISKYIYLPNDIYFVKFKRNVKFNSHLIYSKNNVKYEIYEPEIIRTQCYDKFPCTWLFNYNLKLRGKDLQEGFKIELFLYD